MNLIKKSISRIAAVAFALLLSQTAALAQAIGTWTSYPAYGEMEQIEVAGNVVYALSEGSLFAYNTADQSIQTFSKMDLLNDCSIKMIKWCPTPKLLMILYDNNDIDFLSREGNVENLSAYQNHSTVLDKTVNSLTPVGNNVLMSTNFGVVKISVSEAYIIDTYTLSTATYCCTELNGHLYAATAEGLLVGDETQNLLDRASWTTLSTTAYDYVANISSSLIAVRGGDCSVVDTSTGSATTLMSPYYTNVKTDNGRLLIYGGNYTCVVKAKNDYFALRETHTAMAHSSDDEYFVADSDGWLGEIEMKAGQTPSTVLLSGIHPDGPQSQHFGFLRYKNGKLICGTGDNDSATGTVQILADGEWQILPNDMEQTTGVRYRTTYSVDEDPLETGHYMAATRSGVYEFRDGEFQKLYSLDNSPLQSASGTSSNQANSVIVPGLFYDSEGTLWLTNGMSTTTSLFSMDRNGNFTSHHHSEMMTSSGWSMYKLGNMMTDSRGLIWMGNSNYVTPGLICYQPSTDGIAAYKIFINEDGTNTEVGSVRAIAEDQEGNIWIGTDIGPLYLSASNISSGSAIFTQEKIARDDGTDLADYLLAGEDVMAIAIDKVNRKWIGTNGNGIYVISPDNMEQLYHFTAENSQLLSNYIEAIAIDSETGEVYVGTTYGLCSYKSDIGVIADEMDKSTMYAYPNPVTPDYSGYVTICGLSYGADVKIVSSAGTLIAEGKSSGGTFEWDCRDKKGRRVASGIYMVETAEPDGSAGCVCKIAVVN